MALGAEADLTLASVNWSGILSTFAMVLLIPGFGGAWEEPGWRGYAVPRLQTGRTALRAALILGLLIAGWHLPLIVVGQVSWTDILQIMGSVIVFNWLFNNANGSVLIIMLSHAMNNTVWSTLTSKVVAEPDLARQAVLQAVAWRHGRNRGDPDRPNKPVPSIRQARAAHRTATVKRAGSSMRCAPATTSRSMAVPPAAWLGGSIGTPAHRHIASTAATRMRRLSRPARCP